MSEHYFDRYIVLMALEAHNMLAYKLNQQLTFEEKLELISNRYSDEK
jgi:hypothetical protein